ncbi:Vegetative incompatibility protein [Paramyrothecium foliicola]|nr:Vegetative incompatibility protein [Paramyrothecium foliicola]
MRLLRPRAGVFEEFFEPDVPKYAILSHTWDKEEVSYQQLPSAVVSTAGYQKILNACRETLRHGLEYIWIDTCCIDKTSSAELTEAINSMFRWYEDAEVCFVYLSDVPPTADPVTLESTLRKAKWFTRGWTLQELLVPSSVRFYASDWSYIADRVTISACISGITGIGEKFLAVEPSQPQMVPTGHHGEILSKQPVLQKE